MSLSPLKVCPVDEHTCKSIWRAQTGVDFCLKLGYKLGRSESRSERSQCSGLNMSKASRLYIILFFKKINLKLILEFWRWVSGVL